MVCWLATGNPPISVEGALNPYRRVLDEPPALAWADEPQWPNGLLALLETVLKKHPAERYRSLAGLEADWRQIWQLAERGVSGLFELRARDFP